MLESLFNKVADLQGETPKDFSTVVYGTPPVAVSLSKLKSIYLNSSCCRCIVHFVLVINRFFIFSVIFYLERLVKMFVSSNLTA